MKPGTVAIVQKRKDRIQAPPFVELAGYYMQTAGFLFYCPWLVSGHPHAKQPGGRFFFCLNLKVPFAQKKMVAIECWVRGGSIQYISRHCVLMKDVVS